MECFAGCKHPVAPFEERPRAMEQDHARRSFGIDPHLWKTLTPAQQSAPTRLFVQRVRAARSRAIGKTLVALVGGARGRQCAFTRLRPSALPRGAGNWPRPAPRGKDF